MVRVCVFFESVSGAFQSFQLCDNFPSWSTAADWLAIAVDRFERMSVDRYQFQSRRPKELGTFLDYNIRVTSIQPLGEGEA